MTTLRLPLRALLLTLVLAAAHCDDPADDRPPPVRTGADPPLAVGCADLNDGPIELQGTALLLDSALAECARPGMCCPLFGHDDWLTVAECHPDEQLYAECSSQQLWQLACLGAGGAGGAARPAAGAAGVP